MWQWRGRGWGATAHIKANQPVGGGGEHVCNIGFMVAEQARGRGVATAMAKHALVQAKILGFRSVQFNFVLETNVHAVGLWKKMGFRVVGTLPNAFRSPSSGAYVNALLFFRELDDIDAF